MTSPAFATLPPPQQPIGSAPTSMALIPEIALAGVHGAPFFLDRTEVTVAQYAGCVATHTCTAADEYDPNDPGVSDYNRRLCNSGNAGRAQHPINCVDWSQAEDYCKWRGARLPTEWELLWASQSGDESARYPWGDEPPDATRVNACDPSCLRDLAAWGLGQPGFGTTKALGVDDDGFPETAPVGSFPRGANRWGVLDLSGNVLEWTSTGSGSAMVTHGGGWESNADHLAASWLISIAPVRKFEDLGFRCAKSL